MFNTINIVISITYQHHYCHHQDSIILDEFSQAEILDFNPLWHSLEFSAK